MVRHRAFSAQCYYFQENYDRSSRHWILVSPSVRTTSSSIELIESDQRTQFHTYQREPSQFLVQWFEHEIPRMERERQSPDYNDWRQCFLSKKKASFEQHTWTDWILCHLGWRSSRFVPLDQFVSRKDRLKTMFTQRATIPYHPDASSPELIVDFPSTRPCLCVSARQSHQGNADIHSTARRNRTCWIWLAGSGYRRTKGRLCINTKSSSEPSLHGRIGSDCRESPPCPDRSNDSFVFDMDPTIWNTEGYWMWLGSKTKCIREESLKVFFRTPLCSNLISRCLKVSVANRQSVHSCRSTAEKFHSKIVSFWAVCVLIAESKHVACRATSILIWRTVFRFPLIVCDA